MFKQRKWSWRGGFAGLLVVGLLGVLPAAPAQAQAQRPLLLIGGTFATAEYLNKHAKPWFVSNGYDPNRVYTMGLATDNTLIPGAEALIDVFAATQGFLPDEVSGAGTASIDRDANDPSSGLKIAAMVDAILAANPGADKVDIIGHSQGGVAARWYVKDSLQRGEDNVGTLISLGGPQRGVFSSGQNATWAFACGAGVTIGVVDVCKDMIVFDGLPLPPFIFFLNQVGDPTPGNVAYYHLYGDDDYQDTFADLGFVGELVPGALHIREWEHQGMRDRMLALL
jgi:pimeloyl-ACP methyl ester carboxylesterase